jgi:hypothetical protein
MNEKPILHKRKIREKIRTCQRIIDDGFYVGNEKICGRIVYSPNKFLCHRCLRDAESEGQATGWEK